MTTMVKQDLQVSTMEQWNLLKNQAAVLLKSGFLPPALRTPEQVLAIMMKGREIGVPPMQAFSQINIIKGKPAISSELMLGLIYRHCPSASIEYKASDETRCVLEAARAGGLPKSSFSFDIEDAKRANLVRPDSGWTKYPRAMLRARAISEMARAMFPDALMGCSYTPEEIEEIGSSGAIEVDVVSQPPLPPEPQEEISEEEETRNVLFDAKQMALKTLHEAQKKSGWKPEEVKVFIHNEYGKAKSADLGIEQIGRVVRYLNEGIPFAQYVKGVPKEGDGDAKRSQKVAG